MDVRFHHEARREFHAILLAEREAMTHAIEVLEEYGDALGAPHSSAVRIAPGLRELRPRGGRSPWRAFYRRVGGEIFVGAFGPEAQSNQRGFERSVRLAVERIADYERRRHGD